MGKKARSMTKHILHKKDAVLLDLCDKSPNKLPLHNGCNTYCGLYKSSLTHSIRLLTQIHTNGDEASVINLHITGPISNTHTCQPAGSLTTLSLLRRELFALSWQRELLQPCGGSRRRYCYCCWCGGRLPHRLCCCVLIWCGLGTHQRVASCS